jgi:hypothetical protein
MTDMGDTVKNMVDTPLMRWCEAGHGRLDYEDDGMSGCPACELRADLKARIEAAERERDAAQLDVATLAGILSRHLVGRQF